MKWVGLVHACKVQVEEILQKAAIKHLKYLINGVRKWMRKVVLFIAMSLDGYIADINGGVGWLNGESDEVENEDTYSEFVKDIDTVIMGWNTYNQVTTELSPTEWVYSDFLSYVITHKKRESADNIKFIQKSPGSLVRDLKEQEGKNIWICGGASIIRQLMQDGLIDRFHISIIPTILGDGIHLFGTIGEELKLKLMQTREYNGIIEVIYEKR